MKKGPVFRFFNNPYVSGILVGILFLFVSSLYASITGKVDIVKGFVFVVTFGVPVGILLALFIIYLIISRVLANRTRPPAYMRYVKDQIQEWTFRWTWDRSKDGRITPVQIQAICPDCESPLMRTPSKTWCPNCKRNFAQLIGVESRMTIEGIIVGNARKRFGKSYHFQISPSGRHPLI